MNSEKPPHNSEPTAELPDAELAVYEDLWRELGTLRKSALSERAAKRIRRSLLEPQAEKQTAKYAFRFPMVGPVWAVTSFALLLLAWILGYYQGKGGSETGGTVARLTQLESQVDSLREGLALALLASNSPFQRLQGVWTVSEHPTPAAKNALFETMRADAEVEVRLAAAQVLGSLGFDAEMTGRMERLLVEEPSALVQLRVLGYLAEGGSEDTNRVMVRLLQRPALAPAVRERIREIQERKL